MKCSYYAHTNGESHDKWQLLASHLTNVADLAGEFAGAFNARANGRLLGLLHDLGKYSCAFQERLQGSSQRVDHSTAGAKVASERYGPVGWLLAYLVAGHHGGLPDGYELENDRLTKSLPDFSAWEQEVALPEDVGKLNCRLTEKPYGFSIAFYLRMLFSCLVDADWTDTARFMNGPGIVARSTITELLKTLDAHLQTLCLSANDTLVNRVRREVLDQCRDAADSDPGWFTLTVPTGGGKTLSSLAFALRHAVRNHQRRVIYGIPFTSIIEQNAQVFRGIFGDDDVLEHHCHVIPATETDGEEADHPVRSTENWDFPLIVTTNVQLLESLFANKSAKCRKLHNIAGSVIILDEAQTLPVPLLKPTLRALKELVANFGCSVVLCTATQPALGGEWGKGLQTREIIADTNHLFLTLDRVRAQKLGPLTDEELVRRIAEEPQCLCIVNSRRHARELFCALGVSGDVWHLSTLMYPAHRTRTLKAIRLALKEGRPCKVISTQLIEAGVDIDFPVVFRAMAGLDSVAQAAGRCNREGRLDYGRLYAFEANQHPPMGWLNKTAGYGNATYRMKEDLLAPESIQCYFNNLYESEKERMGQEIIRMHEVSSNASLIPFPEIARSYKLIEDNTGVVFIETPESLPLIHRLAAYNRDTDAMRRLQQFGVSIYDNEYRRLRVARVVEEIFTDGPVKLINPDLYHPATGLQVEDPRSLNSATLNQ
jgi:CRISPR-associated endonuclease/helicase Cas3